MHQNTSNEISQGSKYGRCSVSVMDTIADPDITFDSQGRSNYFHEYKAAEAEVGLRGEAGKKAQREIVNRIQARAGNNRYDCILGVSGGADSTYLALLAKRLGLKPLLVHFDYGWNSELAVENIELTVKALGLELYTHVMDWPEFRSLQRSYFKASVLDLDVPADHMIFGCLFKVAKKFGVKTILSGNNVWTEHTLPKSWNYNKFDYVNLVSIHKQFENTSLKHLPALGLWHHAWYNLVLDIRREQLLNCEYIDKERIKQEIAAEFGWRDYGGKHHESVFTRFYQGYILPTKFNIDKRKAHLSNLIFSGQLSREAALEELSEPPYSESSQAEDKRYVAKKLGFSDDEFEEVLTQPNVDHEYYGTDQLHQQRYFSMMRAIKPASRIVKALRKR